MNLAPGTSERLFLRLGALIAPAAYKDLRALAAVTPNLDLSDVANGLALRNLDFYGNRVSPMLTMES